jgi:hypothetical protein
VVIDDTSFQAPFEAQTQAERLGDFTFSQQDRRVGRDERRYGPENASHLYRPFLFPYRPSPFPDQFRADGCRPVGELA